MHGYGSALSEVAKEKPRRRTGGAPETQAPPHRGTRWGLLELPVERLLGGRTRRRRSGCRGKRGVADRARARRRANRQRWARAKRLLAFLLVMDASAGRDARRLRQDWRDALERTALLPSNDNEAADNAPLDMVRAWCACSRPRLGRRSATEKEKPRAAGAGGAKSLPR